jgi:hypothetical protein
MLYEGAKNYSDPNSDVRKSTSRAYNNPTVSNIKDAAFDNSIELLNFSTLPFGKMIKGSKNIIKGYKQVPKQLPGSFNMNYKQGGTTNDYVELDLTPEEIKDLIAQGYVIEELN